MSDDHVGSLSILAVDDHEPNLRLLIAYLESHGHQIKGATNPADAISMLHSGRFDLVVSDLRLGEESGVELCARVRKEIGSLKFMLYTVAQITAEDRTHAKEAGVDIFVHRPVKMSEFLEVIAGLVERG